MKKTNFMYKVYNCFLLIFLASCSSLSPYKVPVLQGNIYDDEDISKLSKGLSKDQVQFIFGTSLIQDPFHSSRWDYYYSIQIGDELIDEMKLSINFDMDGIVESWIIENLSE